MAHWWSPLTCQVNFLLLIICRFSAVDLPETEFPQTLENMENMTEKISIMEKMLEFEKIIEWKSWNFGMRLLSWCQYHSNFSRSLCSLDNFNNIRFSFFNKAIQNHLHHKTNTFIFIQLFMQYIYFCLLYSIIWLREGRIHTLNVYGNLLIDHGIISNIITQKSWNFILYFIHLSTENLRAISGKREKLAAR